MEQLSGESGVIDPTKIKQKTFTKSVDTPKTDVDLVKLKISQNCL